MISSAHLNGKDREVEEQQQQKQQQHTSNRTLFNKTNYHLYFVLMFAIFPMIESLLDDLLVEYEPVDGRANK